MPVSTPFLNADNTNPAVDAKTVAPDDDNDLPDGPCRALYIGTQGTVVLTTVSGTTVTLVDVIGILPVCTRRVFNTGTDAADIVALY